MPPPADSPFKKDEPVARSAKWMWLAFVSVVIWTLWFTWNMLAQLDLNMLTLWRLINVSLQVALVIVLGRIARAASRCRTHRSFDVMAAAVRAQRPFWALMAVTVLFGSLTLAVQLFSAVDRNRAMRWWIGRMPAPAAPAPSNTAEPTAPSRTLPGP
jgi:hypothetical protein